MPTTTKSPTARWADATGVPTLFLLATGAALDDEIVAKITGFLDGKTYPNMDLVIATEGGFGSSAFRLTCILRRHIKDSGKLRAIAVGDCYSAGTIAVLGCDEILTGDLTVFGPIDPQLRSRDTNGKVNQHSALDLEAGLQELQAISLDGMSGATSLVGQCGNLPVEQAANFGVAFSAAVAKSANPNGIDLEQLGSNERDLAEAHDFGAAQLHQSHPEWSDDHREKVLNFLTHGLGSHSYPIMPEDLASMGFAITALQGELATLSLELAELANSSEVLELVEPKVSK